MDSTFNMSQPLVSRDAHVVFNCFRTNGISRTKEAVNPVSDQSNYEVQSEKRFQSGMRIQNMEVS